MSDNALQATLTMQLGQTLAALKNVQTELGAVKKAVREVKAEKNGMQVAASSGYRRLADRAKEAAKESKGFGDTMRNSGMALTRFGGPLGTIAGQLGGGAGMAGAFGRVAAGAALAGIAFRAFMAVADASTESVRKATEAAARYRAAIKSGQQEEASQALAGLGQESTVRKLMFRGGQNAVQLAQGLAQDHGMTFDEAAEVVTTTASLPKATQAKVIQAAMQARDTGEESGAEAAKKIVDNPFLLERLTPSDQDLSAEGWHQGTGFQVGRRHRQEEVAARVVRMATAGEDDDFGKTYGAGFDPILAARLSEMGGDPYLTATRGAKGTLAQESVIERLRATRIAQGLARDKVTKAANPVAAQLQEVDEVNRQRVADIEAMADSQGLIAAGVANLNLLAGGPGSQHQQALKERLAQSRGSNVIDTAAVKGSQITVPTVNVRLIEDRTRTPIPGGTE